MIRKYILINTIVLTTFLFAQEIYPISKTEFQFENGNIINLYDNNFILIYLKDNGIGNFYAVDKDGTVWKKGPITGGAYGYRTGKGLFKIFQKKRYHMSTKYPDENGINNMNYMMKITQSGIALHQGSVRHLSHGCIHIDKKDVKTLFNWANIGTKVIITKHPYENFAYEDLIRIYRKK